MTKEDKDFNKSKVIWIESMDLVIKELELQINTEKEFLAIKKRIIKIAQEQLEHETERLNNFKKLNNL